VNCVLCLRDTSEYPSVSVDFEGRVVDVCDDCMAKADEPNGTQFEFDREGDPAFNGSLVA
jgi:ribosome-binding protein aMBF1 (putative translation factor)